MYLRLIPIQAEETGLSWWENNVVFTKATRFQTLFSKTQIKNTSSKGRPLEHLKHNL